MNATLAVTPPFDLNSGEGYHLREQAALAHYAQQPGVIDHTVTCCRCGNIGRPEWAPIVELGPCTLPPLPRAWSLVSMSDHRSVCSDCFGKAIDAAIKAIVGHKQ